MSHNAYYAIYYVSSSILLHIIVHILFIIVNRSDISISIVISLKKVCNTRGIIVYIIFIEQFYTSY